MDRAWMYDWQRPEKNFRDELEKFIEAAKKDAMIKGVPHICCPCKKCKNLEVYSDPVTIRSHVIVHGFVTDYYIWTHHGEEDSSGVGMDRTDQDTSEFIVQDQNMDDLEEFFDADDLQMLDSRGDGRDAGYCEPVPSCSIDNMCFGEEMLMLCTGGLSAGQVRTVCSWD
ncbi:hypothetical protein U9M48_040306 [Paspalum notatum var. saurae]|uniref:Transposase-associated domain-containing protein n=1 Tax=Paspalum notatum var. saurae TaxID=547442 RepID=A0AAQ3UKR2_PASNO